MLKDKSAKNLRAGETLAALGLVDPAASRYYCAIYQAAVHAQTLRGWTPGRLRSGALEWSHVMVMNNVSLVRGRRSDRTLYEAMREMREEADYHIDTVPAGRLAAHVAAVRAFVEEATR